MERLKKALLIAASSLLFCFPVYADEPEAADLPIEEVNHDIELVNDSTKEASDISIGNLAEIQGGMIKAPSLDPNVENSVLGYSVSSVPNYPNAVRINFYVTGPGPFYLYRTTSTDTTGFSEMRSPYVFDIDTPYYIKGVYSSESLDDLLYSVEKQFTTSDIGLEVGIAENIDYLSNVSIVFTWLLSTIGTLITFILGNPFLAVSLLLFMAGAVISFYARIKNS